MCLCVLRWYSRLHSPCRGAARLYEAGERKHGGRADLGVRRRQQTAQPPGRSALDRSGRHLRKQQPLYFPSGGGRTTLMLLDSWCAHAHSWDRDSEAPSGIYAVLDHHCHKNAMTTARARLRHVLAQAPQAQAQPLDQQRRRAARARPRRAQRRQQHVQQARARAQRLRARRRQQPQCLSRAQASYQVYEALGTGGGKEMAAADGDC